MKPNTLTISELFQMERRYLVPLFQREYVWRPSEQWEPLWDDITFKSDEWVYNPPSSQNPLRTHFLGAVVLDLVDNFGKDLPARSIIDGQQRLTTLQVILFALRDFANVNNQDKMVRRLAKITENDLGDKEQKYKLWPTNADRKFFEDVFEAGSPEELTKLHPIVRLKRRKYPEPRPRLVEAYFYFYDAIKEYVLPEQDADADGEIDTVALTLDDPDAQRRLEAIYETLTRYLVIVQLELEPQDDAQVIFETLNARGEPLRPSDLIRNFVFMEANRHHEDEIELFDSYWREYSDNHGSLSNFWKLETKQGRFNRPRLDLFVFHYLTFLTELDIPITHLFQEFRAWWKKQPRVVENELKRLRQYSDVFKMLIEPQSDSRLSLFARRLRIIDTSTVYPLLLFLLGEKKEEIPQSELDGIITDLESYLVRRMVCNLTTKNYNRVFLSILKNLRQVEQVDRAAVRVQLLSSDADAARWPSDAEFKNAWMNYPVYNWLKGRTSMVLEALDSQLETSKQETVHITSPITVEHVMPQGWSEENWPFSTTEGTSDMSYDERVDRRRRLLQTFGNLTLVTQPLNSTLSNGPFAKKQPEIARQSKLRLNIDFQKPPCSDNWTEDNIVERGERLFKVALQIWPKPAA